MHETGIGGQRMVSDGRPSEQFAKGRVCVEDGCGTRLSVYNDGDHCALHAPMQTPRTRGKKLGV